MADLLDKGEQEMQQLVTRVSMKAGEAGFKASLQLTKQMTLAPFKAAQAIFTAVSQELHKSKASSKLSLKAFSEAAQGKREVLDIDDAKVSKEFERELNKHGVMWSVERHPDGTQTFHIQGKDAELVQHALRAAAQRVDEKLARNAPELQADRPEHQAAHTPDQIAPHGADELREGVPAHKAAERAPGLTPVDSTRTQIKTEITKRVDAEKARASTKKTPRERTKQQSHGRSDEATAAKTTRR